MLGAGGVAPSRCEGPVENLDAKSCILVTVAVKFLAFENYGQEVWGTNTLLVPNLKVGGPVSPGFYGCCAYALSLGYDQFFGVISSFAILLALARTIRPTA